MSLTVSRVLHAGFVFESSQTKIIFDPVFETPFSRNCYPYPAVEFDRSLVQAQHFDAVFISHYHDDHCSFDSLNLIDKDTPVFIYCEFPEMAKLLKELGFKNVHSLAIDQAVAAGDFTVTPRRALDAHVDALFQIQADGLNILNVVDAWIDDETIAQLAQLGPWDLILWPFQTLRETAVLSPFRAEPAPIHLPADWFEQLGKLAPRILVPGACQFIHETWSWLNRALFPITYEQFENEMSAALPATKIVRMNPSTRFTLTESSYLAAGALAWVKPVGDQMVDYRFSPDLAPPPTSHVAQNFQALTDPQSALCLRYCESGLTAKFKELSETTPDYFLSLRRWRLRLYDHSGNPFIFIYHLVGDSCVLSTNGDEESALSWTTDLPISKLHSALTEGESLTSMYLRINDQEFDPATERQLAEVDVVDDPLVRCLFNGAAASYQLAQLQRLLGRNKLS